MAKYIVKQSSTTILDNGNGYLNIYLLCELINSGGNPRIFKFRIVPDETYPDINVLNNIIKYGFSFAEINKKKIEYSEFPERLYLNFSLPSLPDGRLQPYRFSGEEQINTKGHN
ncbi:hypothetical protein EHE21_08850 [Proteus sp. GOKU]|uniref:hypothetical protein n=1 Tax=Proteus TaxID=583 RepID=UPI001892BB1A|nr:MULTISPECIES: hypothetical protein [Proteus]QPB79483.1 hypothetical protein EHE21_08850 [Proteus sp. GOKU]QQP25490.1 hypothetical protein D7029_08850 [Proteus vulgaris]